MDTASTERGLDRRIADKVRELRQQRGLSLEALAGRCDVSRSMLSLIERAETSATAVTLDKVARGLEVPLGQLLEGAPAPGRAPSPLARRSEQTVWRDPESRYERRQLSPQGWGGGLNLAEILLPAKARVTFENGHAAGKLRQQVWLLAGTLELTANGTKHVLHEGDCLAMDLEAPTVFYNPKARAARYLVAVASAGEARR
jgi:transcriptional regulator with XRE-family HTH domain